MVLLNNVVEVLTLPYFDALVLILIVLFNGRSIGATFIDVDQARFPIGPYSLSQKSLGGFFISLGSQQKIDSLAFLIDGTIEKFPLIYNFDIRVSKPKEPPLQLLAELSVTLSRHSAPIIQLMVYIQASSEEID